MFECDLCIRDGYIVDGTGSPGFRGDVAVKNDRIAKVGSLGSVKADIVIDAEKNLIVSPGFIDIHVHTEPQILVNARAESLVRQGVTTVITGNCGFSAGPIGREHASLYNGGVLDFAAVGIVPDWSTLGEYFHRIEEQGVAVNIGSLVGLANCRITAMGADAWDRSPSKNELHEMKELVASSMDDGAFGLSAGLEYPPQNIAETDEIVELCKIAMKYGGIYSTHIRNRDIQVVDAAKEAIRIGREAQIPVECSHFGARFPSDGKTKWIVELCDKARKEGLDIAFDQIPWETDDEGICWMGFGIADLLFHGSEYVSKGRRISLSMLKDPEIVESLKKSFVSRQYGPIFMSRGLLGSWDRLVLVHCSRNPQYDGRNFAEIGLITGKDPFDTAVDILVAEGEEFQRVWGKIAITTLWDTNFSLLHPFCSVTTDAGVDAPYGRLSECPVSEIVTRSYKMFPYLFQKWVREYGLITLEDAVRKCSGLPAQRMRLMNRGLIRPGMYADIVIFDRDRIMAKSTMEEPRQYPEGIRSVITNGKIVIREGEHTGALPGKVLRLGS